MPQTKKGKKMEQLGPKEKTYIATALNYSNKVSIYLANSDINYQTDWTYLHSPNK